MADFDKNRFKTVNQEWVTPDNLFNKINLEFNFDIDLAADEKNKKCDKYYSESDDAMIREWCGICWLNPPYGKKDRQLKDWVKKSYHESQVLERCTVVMLIPARTNTKWWHDYCMKAKEIKFIVGRPKFKGCTYGLPQPLAIIIFKSHIGETKFSSFSLK